VNWGDEEYVRLYVRDTVTWKLLGWEGRTVLLHMLRGKFDRSGVFVTGGHTLSRAVTAATDLPPDVAERVRRGPELQADCKGAKTRRKSETRCRESTQK
jgi:hypothetical protein